MTGLISRDIPNIPNVYDMHEIKISIFHFIEHITRPNITVHQAGVLMGTENVCLVSIHFSLQIKWSFDKNAFIQVKYKLKTKVFYGICILNKYNEIKDIQI